MDEKKNNIKPEVNKPQVGLCRFCGQINNLTDHIDSECPLYANLLSGIQPLIRPSHDANSNLRPANPTISTSPTAVRQQRSLLDHGHPNYGGIEVGLSNRRRSVIPLGHDIDRNVRARRLDHTAPPTRNFVRPVAPPTSNFVRPVVGGNPLNQRPRFTVDSDNNSLRPVVGGNPRRRFTVDSIVRGYLVRPVAIVRGHFVRPVADQAQRRTIDLPSSSIHPRPRGVGNAAVEGSNSREWWLRNVTGYRADERGGLPRQPDFPQTLIRNETRSWSLPSKVSGCSTVSDELQLKLGLSSERESSNAVSDASSLRLGLPGLGLNESRTVSSEQSMHLNRGGSIDPPIKTTSSPDETMPVDPPISNAEIAVVSRASCNTNDLEQKRKAPSPAASDQN